MRPGLGEKLVHLRFETQFAEWKPFGLLEYRDLVAAQQAVKGQGGIPEGFGQEPEQAIHGIVRGRYQQDAFIVSHQGHRQRAESGPTSGLVVMPDGGQHGSRCPGSGGGIVFTVLRVQPWHQSFGRPQGVRFGMGRHIG